jgi:hypothetical protein
MYFYVPVFIVMLSVVMLSVVMLSVVMLSVVMLNVVMLSVVMPNVLAPVVAKSLKENPSGSVYTGVRGFQVFHIFCYKTIWPKDIWFTRVGSTLTPLTLDWAGKACQGQTL